jgi:DNA helicase-2/ATP-dependent DNA helicase PcrA
VDPNKIFLSTFTEKAALQLKQGLHYLLSIVTEKNNIYYDLSNMYIGTVHSLCHKMLSDRNFYESRIGVRPPVVMDELSQYFFIYQAQNWDLIRGIQTNITINNLFGNRSNSRHKAVISCISLFNRLSEECIDPVQRSKKITKGPMKELLPLYKNYLTLLDNAKKTDLSLLQKKAFDLLQDNPKSTTFFKYIIIDEYQDTNTIQEKIFFHLAQGHKNICVVGDDDQALYRFRGATVENFVQFPSRCKTILKKAVTTFKLEENFRSLPKIVDFYNSFILQCKWTDEYKRSYRVPKKIYTNRKDRHPSVLVTSACAPTEANLETARLIKEIVDKKYVQNPNQIAFLYPSLKSEQARRMIDALENEGLKVYAPRAGHLLDLPEAKYVFGLLQHIFGKCTFSNNYGADMELYGRWLEDCYDMAGLILQNMALADFIHECRSDLDLACSDYKLLMSVCNSNKWRPEDIYSIEQMESKLISINNLSTKALKNITSKSFKVIINKRNKSKTPFKLKYIIKRATSVDWNILDVLYKLFAFNPFKNMFDIAERQVDPDEGPICNLSIISHYLARFINDFVPLLSADLLVDNNIFSSKLFNSYLLSLFRLQESEYENPDDPFPTGRIAFITIHQAKGLEFPVVVLGNPRKDNKGPQLTEELVSPLIKSKDREPLNLAPEFDIMRMFYVALSRAENLLIINRYRGQGQRINLEFLKPIDQHSVEISDIKINSLKKSEVKKGKELPTNYSYTGDFLAYQRCPRQYMIFHKYRFSPSRSQMMFFGNLVHKTLDELHNYLIVNKNQLS